MESPEKMTQFLVEAWKDGEYQKIVQVLPESHKAEFLNTAEVLADQLSIEFYVNFVTFIGNTAILIEKKKDFILGSIASKRWLEDNTKQNLQRNWLVGVTLLRALSSFDNESSNNELFISFLNHLLKESFTAMKSMTFSDDNWKLINPGIQQFEVKRLSSLEKLISTELDIKTLDGEYYVFPVTWKEWEGVCLPELYLETYKFDILPVLQSIQNMPTARLRRITMEMTYLFSSLNRAAIRLNRAETQEAFNETLYHMGGIIMLRLMQLKAL